MGKHPRTGLLKLMFALAVVVLCIYIACSPLQEVDYKYLAIENFESGFCLGAMIWLPLTTIATSAEQEWVSAKSAILS